KQKELEEVANPIMMKLYSAGGVPGAEGFPGAGGFPGGGPAPGGFPDAGDDAGPHIEEVD
ncbi:hypothetical protein BC938DRAFT_470642, partial [Jimgerdemannia flammicorona]